MKRAILAGLLLLASFAAAFGQSVTQSGSVSPNHPVRWVTSGIIADGGTAASPSITSFGVLSNSIAGICNSSAAAGSASNRLCLGARTAGTAAISLEALNGASAQNFQLIINGVTFTWPTTAGSAGQCLSSSGGGATPMTWATCASSSSAAGSNTQLQFNSSGIFGASANLTWVSPALTIGVAGSATGQLKLTGATSGTITIAGQAAAGTFNWNLPTGAGTSGQPLLSGGGGASPMTFGTLSVGGGGTGATTFTANAPLIGNGSSAIASATASGNTTTFGTTSGSLTSGNCASWDASGNLVDSGLLCGATVSPNRGGTGQTSLTAHAVILGNGTSPVNFAAPATAGNLLIDQGAAADPVFTAVTGDVTINSSGATTIGTTKVTNAMLAGSIAAAKLIGTDIATVGTLTAGATGAGFTVALTTSTVTGTLTVPNGGTGGTTYTANVPLIGAGAGAITSGTRSGSTTKFVTTTGTLTSGDCVSIDGSGNFIAAGGACTTGGGGGTVTAATAGQVTYYATSSTTVVGNANLNVSAGALTIGQAGSVIGQLKLAGNTSGTITITPQAAAGTFNFNLPITAGTSGQPLLSGGGSSTAMSWGSLSGNTTTFGTVSGSLTSGNCIKSDASGNLIDAAGTCGTGTVNSGTANQLAYYAGTGTAISGNSSITTATVILNNATTTITKGFTYTPNNIGTVSSGTTTLDCTAGNYQYLTNNGAFTLATQTSDCGIDLLVTNGASAGAITFSGFTVGSVTGSTITTTNTSKFLISTRRINGTSTYSAYSLQ